MTCFLFTHILGHFRPWEAACEHLHTCAVSTLQPRPSGMVWSLSYDRFSVYLCFCPSQALGKLSVSISTLVRFQRSKRDVLGWSGAGVMRVQTAWPPLDGKWKENSNPRGGPNEGKSGGGPQYLLRDGDVGGWQPPVRPCAFSCPVYQKCLL